jgi:hypothetical protein
MTIESLSSRLHQQTRQWTGPAGRACVAGSLLFEEGLRRALPIEHGSRFDDLIAAIDTADDELRKR